MRLTNELNLPEPLYAAIANDDYDPGDSDITVTQLISPPRQVALMRLYGDKITEDASDRIYSLVGQAIHTILERAGKTGIREQRLYAWIGGWKVGGKFDRLALINDPEGIPTLQDYKVMSIGEVFKGLRDERAQQLNLLCYLARKNGYRVERLQAVGILRDWSKLQVRRRDYPTRQVMVFDVPMWTPEEQKTFLEERVRLHQAARKSLPDCTPEERWSKPDTWAVMKEGRKSALRVLGSYRDAAEWCLFNDLIEDWRDVIAGPEPPYEQLKPKKGIRIEHRPGEDTRCNHYCAVRDICQALRNKEAAE